MAKVSANYEVVYIIDPAQGEEGIASLIANFKALAEQNGSAVEVEEWGTRKLAYPINYKTEGYYVLMYVTAPADLPRELERNFQINEAVLRSLVIRFEGALPPKREALKPNTFGQQPAAEAPAQEAVAEAPAEEAAPAEAVEAAPAE